MISVAALTAGRNTPSARFRVRQHVAGLLERGISVQEFVPLVARDAPKPKGLRWVPAPLAIPKLMSLLPGVIGSLSHDVTWLQRPLFSQFPSLEPLLHRPLVFDLDDAIWLQTPWGDAAAKCCAERAEVVIAGNHHLADYFRQDHRDVRIIPTAVDTDRFHPRAAGERPGHGNIVLGWSGTSWNLRYLERIEKPLRSAMEVMRNCELLVVADRPPDLPLLPRDRVRFERWRPESEAAAIRRMDVGLMPLEDSPWARGKCSFKMLTYMASGLPVVASPVGMNREVFAMGEIGYAAETEDEWTSALLELGCDEERRERFGAGGRSVVVERFSADVIVARLAALFRELA